MDALPDQKEFDSLVEILTLKEYLTATFKWLHLENKELIKNRNLMHQYQ